MVERPAVSVQIAGTTYRIQSSASPDEVQRLADLVDEKMREVNPADRPPTPQLFLLVAMSFAHELEQERLRRQTAEAESRDLLRRLTQRPDQAADGNDPPPRAPRAKR